MQQNESPFLEKYKHEKELRHLQMQLEEKVHELQCKEARIFELENFITHVQNTLSIKEKLKEDQTQCSFDEDSIKEQADLIKRLGEVLTARQQEGMGLHLASREIEEENSQLKLTLQDKEEQLRQTKHQLNVVEGYLQIGMKDLEFLCNQNKELKDKIAQLEESQLRKTDERDQLQMLKRSLVSIRSQKGMLQQQLKTEEQKSAQMKMEIQRLRNDLELQINQLQQSKGALNSYDWKLFCLETQLDLIAKERKQLKFLNEKLQVRVAEMQVTLKQQLTAVFSSEEEIRLLQGQNRYLRVESERKQEKLEKMLIEMNMLREDLENQNQVKQLEYRLKEKDEELNEIALYLKQKIGQLDQVKHRAAIMDKKIFELQLTLQKREQQNYELQQGIIENQQILEKQSLKIEELQKVIQFNNKRIEDNSILAMLRASEWNLLRSGLQATIESQEKKINQLSVEIIERDIAANKKEEQLKNAEIELERIQEELLQRCTRLTETELKLAESNMQNQKLGEQVHKLIQKNSQQIILLKKSESCYFENQRIRQISQDLSKQLSKKIDEITKFKQMLVENAQSQLYLEQQIQELQQQIEMKKRHIIHLEQDKKQKQVTIQTMRKDARSLNIITQLRIQQMSEVISQSIENSEQNDQTTKFEIMQEDDQTFEVMQSKLQRQRNQLKAKIDQYKSQVISILKVFD